MGDPGNREIYTIGHSTHPLDEFVAVLQSFHIELLADVRGLPGSRKFPHFDKEALEISMPEHNIEYMHIEKLGGRRKVKADSKNTAWRHPAFRGYADYMETDSFKEGLLELKEMALEKRTACMCAEVLWWRCHRSMIADVLKSEGWKVLHIMGAGKSTEHPYTQPAKIIDGKLSYGPE